MNFVQKNLNLKIEEDFQIIDEINSLFNFYQMVYDNLNQILENIPSGLELHIDCFRLETSFSFDLDSQEKLPMIFLREINSKYDLFNNRYTDFIDRNMDVFFADFFKNHVSFLSWLKTFSRKLFFQFDLIYNHIQNNDLFKNDFFDLLNSYCFYLFKNKLNIKKQYKDDININLIRTRKINSDISYQLKIVCYGSIHKKHLNLNQSFEIKKHEDLIEILLKSKCLIESTFYKK